MAPRSHPCFSCPLSLRWSHLSADSSYRCSPKNCCCCSGMFISYSPTVIVAVPGGAFGGESRETAGQSWRGWSRWSFVEVGGSARPRAVAFSRGSGRWPPYAEPRLNWSRCTGRCFQMMAARPIRESEAEFTTPMGGSQHSLCWASHLTFQQRLPRLAVFLVSIHRSRVFQMVFSIRGFKQRGSRASPAIKIRCKSYY